jgi:proteic killer suppression protein
MIKSFRSKVLRLFAEGDGSKMPVHGAALERAEDQLVALDAARQASDMDVPGWRLHQLRGKPIRFSVRVTGNWRITFEFAAPDAIDVDIEDYH